MHITTEWENKIFHASFYNFNNLAVELFHFQYHNNYLYKQFSDSLGILPGEVNSMSKIPFLPIQFFKSHQVFTTDFKPGVVFESSGTTGLDRSKHYLHNTDLYEKSFTKSFEIFYGREPGWCILGLLPSYLERGNSSLVVMVDKLIKQSDDSLSGFYLHDYDKLHQTLLHNEILEKPTLLIGVTYALLNFTEKYQMKLSHTTVMETGGMKGKHKEITRQEVHKILKSRLGVKVVHSEYGMTELLSQAYSQGDGLFKCPPWMKILIRDQDDPLRVTSRVINKRPKSGAINIIDLANIFSCAFIATEDLGRLHINENFEILGRCDASEVRGCSQLTPD